MLILDDTPLITYMLIESYNVQFEKMASKHTCYTTLYTEYKTNISCAYNCRTVTYNYIAITSK